jgi:hypothetical protein
LGRYGRVLYWIGLDGAGPMGKLGMADDGWLRMSCRREGVM